MSAASMLWTPGRIGAVHLRNRIIMSPMATNFCGVNGEVTEQMVAYYEERARGGPGLVVVEGTAVEYPRGAHGAIKPRVDDDSLLPGLTRLADAIHTHGAAAALQLTHSGGSTNTRATRGAQPVGPSAVRHPHSKIVPHALNRDEVLELIERFASAAHRAQRAGFDAAEIHGGHMYLVAQFLCPLTNKRDDEFGGPLENRTRFACEIVKAIRHRCGKGFGVLFRISGDDFEEGGRSLAETAEMAKLLEAAGVDALDVSAGLGKTAVTCEPISYEQGWRAYLAAEIRKAVSIPVIAVGVIRYPDVAEAILAEGKADFVALGRAFIADPYWPMKARYRDPREIRPCISCNAGCIGRRVFGSASITCTVNPMAGREARERGRRSSRASGATVSVVGGGPAGMQAAIAAAEADCTVHLFERQDRLGGQLWPASAPPHKGKLKWLLEHLVYEVNRRWVMVHLMEEVSPASLPELPGSVAIVAVGSEPSVPPIEGVRLGHVVAAREVLTRLQSFPGARVVVIGGGMVGCEASIFLAQASKQVVVVEQLPAALTEMEPVSRDDTFRLMREAGVRLVVGATVERIGNRDVAIRIGGETEVLEADAVVLAAGATPLGRPWYISPPGDKVVTVIGDAARPASILEAMRDAVGAAELALRNW